VTTHTSNASVPGWSGVGYIVVNPKTGDGGYYISGGENGAFAKLESSLGDFSTIVSVLNDLSSIFIGISSQLAGYFNHLATLFDIWTTYDECGGKYALDHVSILIFTTILSAIIMTIISLSLGISLGGIIIASLFIQRVIALMQIMIGLIGGVLAGQVVRRNNENCKK